MIHNLSFKHEIPPNSIVIDVTSNSKTDGKWLSPFFLGRMELYDGYTATSIENGYQFAKLYFEHADTDHNPTPAYWKWAQEGWNNPKPIKHPLGAWRTPLYHLWKGQRLNRLKAQNEIFVPEYVRLASKTDAFTRLKALYERTTRDIVLLDYEGYQHRFLELDWEQVMNHPDFPIGQGFVLCMMLEGFLKY
jgi:hypothetical protein